MANDLDEASKCCAKCLQQLPQTSFCVTRSNRDGLARECRTCRAAYAQEWYRKTADARRDAGNKAAREKYANDPAERARAIASTAARRRANPEAATAKRRSNYLKTKEAVSARGRVYREANKEKVKAQSDAWRAKNKDKCISYAKKWSEKNKHVLTQNAAVRRAKQRNATPSWSSDEFERLVISEAYRLAKLRSTMVGVVHHVDHIVPLQSTLVCGLHCAANLQVMPGFENQSKKNLYWPEMPT